MMAGDIPAAPIGATVGMTLVSAENATVVSRRPRSIASWQDVLVRDLNPTSASMAGGWDPRWAKVLAVETDDDAGAGAAIVDTNGDGADINIDRYTRAPGGDWEPGPSGNIGDKGWCRWETGVACWGRTTPGRTVQIEYAGARHQVTTASSGWWLFVTSHADSTSEPRHI